MVEKLIEELDGQAHVTEVECGTLICNNFGYPEYMVFKAEEVENYGETN